MKFWNTIFAKNQFRSLLVRRRTSANYSIGIFILLLVSVASLFSNSAYAAKKPKAPKAPLSVVYIVVGSMFLDIEKQTEEGCISNMFHTKRALDKISYYTGWFVKDVYTAQSSVSAALILSAYELSAESVTRNLIACKPGISINECMSPNICDEIIDSCQFVAVSGENQFSTMSIKPVKKGPKNKQWIVTLSKNDLPDIASCAQGMFDNQALKESVFTLKFKITYNKKKKGGLVQLNNHSVVDCSDLPESDGYGNFVCSLKPHLTGSASIKGPFSVSPVK